MYLSDKLKDNIIDRIIELYGDDDTSRSIIRDTIDDAEDDTWNDMTLAERCGPSLWWFLHWMAAVSDNEDNPYLYYKALSILKEGHPCKDICRPHLDENLQHIDPRDFSSAIEHSVSLHNLVNRQLHKDQFPLEEAINRLDLGCDSCTFASDVKGNSSDNNESEISIRKEKGSSIKYPSYLRVRDKTSTGLYQYNRSNEHH